MDLRELIPHVPTRMGPLSLRRFLLSLIPRRSMQTMIGIVDIFEKTSKEILFDKKVALEKGEEAIVQQVGEGKDLMSILRTPSFFLSHLV